ncbi:MAG: hypothetical protein ABIH49_02315 [archaeon]
MVKFPRLQRIAEEAKERIKNRAKEINMIRYVVEEGFLPWNNTDRINANIFLNGESEYGGKASRRERVDAFEDIAMKLILYGASAYWLHRGLEKSGAYDLVSRLF